MSLNTFERGFEDVEKAADAAGRAAKAVATNAKHLMKAAGEGDLTKIRKLADRLAQALETAKQDVAIACEAWPFSPEHEEEYLRDQYAADLLQQAKADGLQMQKQDGTLVAYPSVLRILPSEKAVKVDRTRTLRLRPSKLVAVLKAAQTKRPRVNSQAAFLEAAYAAYNLIVGKQGVGSTVLLARIYAAMTLLPGVSAEYGRDDFARDLLLLDRNGPTHTKSGARVSLPASTGTRGARDVFASVAQNGERVTYYGISFKKAQP